MALDDDAVHQRSAHRNGRAPARAREAESRSGKGEEAGSNGEHVPAIGETGGEAGREISVRSGIDDKPTQKLTQKEPSGNPDGHGGSAHHDGGAGQAQIALAQFDTLALGQIEQFLDRAMDEPRACRFAPHNSICPSWPVRGHGRLPDQFSLLRRKVVL